MGILARLLDLVFPVRDTARVVRELTPETLGALVSPTISPTGVTGLLPYRHPQVRAVIIEAKFNANAKATALLAGVLRDYIDALREESEGLETIEFVVIPLPLGSARLRERGYNQVEEVVKRADVPMNTTLLKRARETKPQTSLPRRARLTNMEGAFAATGVVSPDKTYVLIDDVTTTGATLTAAALALKTLAPHSIALVALAH